MPVLTGTIFQITTTLGAKHRASGRLSAPDYCTSSSQATAAVASPPVSSTATAAPLFALTQGVPLPRAYRDMIHLDRNPDIDQNQKANLILADDHPSSTAAHFPWDPHEHHSDASYANGVLAAPHSASHLDFALAKDPPPSPPHPTLDGTHEDKSSPLSPAPDSASPNHDAKDLPQSHPPPREDPPPFDKGDLDVPREGTLTPLTELSPAPEPDDESDKKDEDDARAGETSTSTLAKDDSRHDDRRKGDPPKPKIINGISSSSSSRSTDGSPIRLLPSTHSSFHNFSADPASSRMAEKSYMFAGPSHSRASSSEYMTPPIMHTAHNMPPPNMAHTSSDAKVIRILDLNAELFKCVLLFPIFTSPADPRITQGLHGVPTSRCADIRSTFLSVRIFLAACERTPW